MDIEKSHRFMEPFFSDLSATDVFLDVGANIGTWAISAACHEPSPKMVYAIEPSPGPYFALLDNIKLNACGERCRTMNVAAATESGFVPFVIDTLDPSTGTSHVASGFDSAHIPIGALWRANSVEITVPTFAISDLIEAGVIESPTLVKIDTEGYEGFVLRGLGKGARTLRRICLEIHPNMLADGSTPASLVKLVEELGFSVRQVDRQGRQLLYLFDRR